MSGSTGDIDVMSAIVNPGGTCVLVMMIRGGRMLGNKTFFPRIKVENTPSEVLSAFIPRFYLAGLSGREIPKEIIVNAKIPDKSVITDVLSETANRKVAIADSVRGHRNRWLQLANTNAEQSLGGHLANRNNLAQRFSSLQNVLKLDEAPERLECFDISHSSGEATVASCVVFDQNGPLKSDYRRFNIEGITPGDDYAAMAQALTRRYTRLKKGEGKLPDILFIDGGKGQLSEAMKVMDELQINDVLLIGSIFFSR